MHGHLLPSLPREFWSKMWASYNRLILAATWDSLGRFGPGHEQDREGVWDLRRQLIIVFINRDLDIYTMALNSNYSSFHCCFVMQLILLRANQSYFYYFNLFWVEQFFNRNKTALLVLEFPLGFLLSKQKGCFGTLQMEQTTLCLRTFSLRKNLPKECHQHQGLTCY